MSATHPTSPLSVCITGASGFIGSHLCDIFLAAGARVVGVDNFITGRKSNLAHLLEPAHPQFQLIEADASTDPSTYLPADFKPDLVCHFASPASPPWYQKYPRETYLVNAVGTHLWLSHLRQHAPNATFVFASTSEVYGDPQVHPQPESYWGNVNPNGIRSCYDEAKRFGEMVCGVHQRDYGLDVRIVRIFNTYGPRMNPADGRVIPDFAVKMLTGQPILMFGTGSQTRSYCYIDDLVAGIFEMATKPNLSGQTINLGNPEEYTVQQTAEEIWQVLKSQDLAQTPEMQITFQPLPSDDPERRKPDITRANTVLNWQPRVSFREGLKSTLQYFKANLPGQST